MSKCYKPIGPDSVVIFQRADDGFSSDVSIKAEGFVAGIPITTAFSRPLSTSELGDIASYCALIYYRRTGKVPMPICDPPFTAAVFDQTEQPEEVPKLDRRIGERETAGCPHCLDECTGECL